MITFFLPLANMQRLALIHQSEILAETVNRAGLHNESYMEIMFTLDGNASGKLAKDWAGTEILTPCVENSFSP